MQVFTYRSGIHDVWELPDGGCNFDSPEAREVGPRTQGTAKVQLNDPGTYYFACKTIGHCEAGQRLQINVLERGNDLTTSPPIVPDEIPPMDGKADECVSSDLGNGEVFVTCRSSALSLKPGDNIYPTIPLPSPYPSDETVFLKTVSAEIVDGSGRPVPLSEVYLHHTFGDYRFIPGEGSEIRRSPMRNPLPDPYALIVKGSDFNDENSRNTNIHVIRTVGVPDSELKPCIECWCKGSNPFVGSIGCCVKCTTNSTEGSKDYHLLYNVTYQKTTTQMLQNVTPVVHVALDINGGVEYSVDNSGPGTKDIVDKTFEIDYFCPQSQNFSLIRCWAHQHIGGECITMSDPDTGDIICKSCPEYGTEEGVPGNEKGYVIGMTEDRLVDAPYTFQPGQKVRVQAVYDSADKYGGVMSIMALGLTGFDIRKDCNVDFAGFIQVRFLTFPFTTCLL